jgi:uncharacterized membrane protein YfcA
LERATPRVVPPEVLLSSILGVVTGALLGLLGGGGSIIAVPVMVYVLGLETKTAIGSSLLIVGISSLLAAYSHHRKKYVLVKLALMFGLSGAVGSFLGGKLAAFISDQVQLTLFASIMALVGFFMFKHRKTKAVPIRKTLLIPVTFASGFGAGLLTGLLGVGGGFIIVPVLTMVLGLPIKEAVGSSLLVIGMNSIVGAAAYGSHINFAGPILPFAAGTLTAAPIAGHFSQHVKQDILKKGFASGLLLLSAWMFLKQINSFH